MIWTTAMKGAASMRNSPARLSKVSRKLNAEFMGRRHTTTAAAEASNIVASIINKASCMSCLLRRNRRRARLRRRRHCRGGLGGGLGRGPGSPQRVPPAGAGEGLFQLFLGVNHLLATVAGQLVALAQHDGVHRA